jgi:ATP-dependent RNA helicase MSS116
VTLVLQVGLPADGDQYIHRLGRTARAGAAGRGIIILSPAEQVFLSSKTIRDLPITAHQPAPSQVSLAPFVHEISAVLGKVSDETKESAYRAWLGYYNGSTKDMKWSKEQLVREGWDYAVQSLGWTGSVPPSIEPKTVGKMGLRGVPGLNISSARGGGGGVRGGGALRGRGQRY